MSAAISQKSKLWFRSLAHALLGMRRTRLYCLGTGKSGTHSLAEMFARGARADHEVQTEILIPKILDALAGRISQPEFAQWLRGHDRKMALEVDSSQLNYYLVDILLKEFPDARFVLTIRDSYSWLDSIINHVLHHEKATPAWIRLRDLRYQSDIFTHAPAERLLKEKGLHTLDGYLSYWAKHNGDVVNQVPAERLLVVRTDQIRQRALEICDFAGLPHRAVDLDRTHAFQNPEKFNLVRQLDRDFLEQKMEQHCRPLLTRVFPEIKSFADSKL